MGMDMVLLYPAHTLPIAILRREQRHSVAAAQRFRFSPKTCKLGRERGANLEVTFRKENDVRSAVDIMDTTGSQGFPPVTPTTSTTHQPPERTSHSKAEGVCRTA
jgi:hypothetical protein